MIFLFRYLIYNNNSEMNETSQNPHRTLMLTFSFDIDIEKVYLGIFSKQCLEKIGLYRTDISSTEDEIERYLTINSLPMDMHKLNFISTPTSKTIEEKVVSLNKKKLPQISLYVIISM